MSSPPHHPFACQIERHALLDSTNRLAAERIHALWQNNESPANLVIIADQQTAGRGQHGREWISPVGGLYVSVVLEKVPVSSRDKLALIAGVTVAKALRHATNVEVLLRWPNDLIYRGKKMGGILCEALASGERWAAIIGVGLNINTHLEDLPNAIRPQATSLLAHHKRQYDLSDIERALLGEFSTMLTRLAHEGASPFIHRAQQLDELRGKSITLREGDHLHAGTAAGISDSGELLVQIGGDLRAFSTGTLVSIEGDILRR